MPSGQIPKIFGTICNVPVDTVEITDVLSRSADSSELVYVKLKRKLEYHGHVLFEPVRPVFLDRLLRFLNENNALYHNIVVKTENIPPHLSSSSVFDNSSEQNINDGFVVNNGVDVQEIAKDINVGIPIFNDDKRKQLRKLQVIRMSIVLLLMKHV